MNKTLSLFLLAVPCFLPAFRRLLTHDPMQPLGMLSDCALGLFLLLSTWSASRWLRVVLIVGWAILQIAAGELFAAMQRLPSWQDVQYLFDPDFLTNSMAGLHFASPLWATILLLTALLSCLPALPPPSTKTLRSGFTLVLALLLLQGELSKHFTTLSPAARYNPLHWIVTDAVSAPFHKETQLTLHDLPAGLRQLDLSGRPIIKKGQARNVLLIVLEGTSGVYHPEIREAMGLESDRSVDMTTLVQATGKAALIPDFVTHSHQTIRGLYSMLCGDFSKFSFETSKAFELMQDNTERADDCLPALMAVKGWDTHYLQGADLTFMSKDQVMPTVGFKHVHGREWFTGEERDSHYIWGADDPVFFKGAHRYINDLQSKDMPWMVTLLTVGTHQPYDVSDAFASDYPSRKLAAVAVLDKAVAAFIEGLRRDGVLENTLVVITSDESHGSDIVGWASSWGLTLILAPEQDKLPRLIDGTFGLVDMEASILDYLGLDIPPSIIGRSFFRKYNMPREMLSYTSSTLRYHSAEGERFECTRDGNCLHGAAPSILGPPPATFRRDDQGRGQQFFAMASVLDHKLVSTKQIQSLQFARGQERQLSEKKGNEWAENLIGAQYLDFPAGSKVRVAIRIKALKAQPEGIQMKLTLRQFEQEVTSIAHEAFPLLYKDGETHLEFSFDNPKSRQAFSFHLTRIGKDSLIKLEDFRVIIDKGKG